MKEGILLDTGPLVAFLNRRDQYYNWSLLQWAQILPPMRTCEAVLSETLFLLGDNATATDAVMRMLAQGIITVPFSLSEHNQRIAALLKKYHSVPISLADACLVRMSEVYPESLVFTIDSDFTLYRRNGRQAIPTIMPAS